MWQPLLVHKFLMVRRTKAQVMEQLPDRLDEQVDVPLSLALARDAILRYGATAEQCAAAAALAAAGGAAGGAAVGAAVGGAAPDDSLHVAGIKSAAHRLGLLKALALAETDSWLHARYDRPGVEREPDGPDLCVLPLASQPHCLAVTGCAPSHVRRRTRSTTASGRASWWCSRTMRR